MKDAASEITGFGTKHSGQRGNGNYFIFPEPKREFKISDCRLYFGTFKKKKKQKHQGYCGYNIPTGGSTS